jgi:tRNA (cmo5U34)-methyltransferase
MPCFRELQALNMSRDTLYAQETVADAPFEFTEDVARVFPDMLQRSIPGYAASIKAIGTLAAEYVQPNSRCYDLGCSLGAATLAMRRNIEAAGCRIIAVDNAPAMVRRCRELLAADEKPGPAEISVIEANIQDVEIARASMVVMNYTLQFLPLEERSAMIEKIAKGLLPGGVLILSEKVVDEDPVVEKSLQNLHHEFKRRNAYSDLEISRKRAALENVLVPETVKALKLRLTDAGFSNVGVWLRYFNFISIIAIR